MTTLSDTAVPGASLILHDAWNGVSLVRVERITKTQIVIVGSDTRYNRETGRMIGVTGYNTPRLKVPSEDDMDRIGVRKVLEAWSRVLKQLGPRTHDRFARALALLEKELSEAAPVEKKP